MKNFSVIGKKNNSILLEYSCLHIAGDDFKHTSSVYAKISKDVLASWKDFVTMSGHGRNRLILNFLAEGCDPHTAQPIIDVFAEYFDFKHIMAFYNVPVDAAALPYRAVSCPWYLLMVQRMGERLYTDESETRSLELDKKFLCLMRRPSWSRAKFAYALTNTVRDSSRISFGSLPNSSVDLYQNYFNTEKLPLLIDGTTSFETQHNKLGREFYSCLFNIVVESSSQSDENVWRSIFITEKTFKAFLLRQIPIWFAVPGLVNEVRKMGFDVFDDIVDHSYDQIDNEYQRITAISQQILHFDRAMTLADCQSLRSNIWNRLNANADLVKKLYQDGLVFENQHKFKFFDETTQ